jgi:hypothetical protein
MPDTFYPDLEQRYDVMKKKAQQQAAQQAQMEQDALKRKFSSLGMGSSGEAIKQESLAQQRGGNMAMEATQGIEAQKAAEVGQREYAGQVRKEEQAFAAGEAEKQRGFAKEEALAQRQFASLEAQYGRDFAASQSKLERNQKQSMFDAQQKFASKQFKWQQEISSRDYELDKMVTDFNMKMAKDAANKRSFTERLADPFGVMGASESGKTKWNPEQYY